MLNIGMSILEGNMRKSIIKVICFCVLSMVICGCTAKEDVLSFEDTLFEEHLPEESFDISNINDSLKENDDLNVDNSTSVHAQYIQVLNDYKQMINDIFSDDFEQKVNDGYFEAPDDKFSNDWFSMIIDAKHGLNNIGPNSFGYALYDIDGDKSEELILLREDYFVLAIYTTVKTEVKLLGAYYYKNRGIILNNGCIYNFVSESAISFEHNVYRLKSGELLKIKSFGSNDGNYYELSDSEQKQISEAEFEIIKSKYPSLSDQHYIKEYMSNAGIVFVSLNKSNS